jgi:Icc protein
VTYASLCSVLDHYRDNDWRADLVVVTGDLVQDDSAGAYEHFCQLLASLQLPVYCVPGNHDVRALMRDALAEPPFHYCASAESGNWLITGIDSCVTDHAGGHVEAAELARLDNEIASSRAENVMVCLHHPPVQMGSKWLDTVGMDNGAEFLERIAASGKVRLAIFGHVHQPYDAEHGGVSIVATPSTCRQFAQGSDDFAVDDNPPAYRRISLFADGKYDHELVWLTT